VRLVPKPPRDAAGLRHVVGRHRRGGPNQFLNPDGTQGGLDADLCGAIGAKRGAKVE